MWAVIPVKRLDDSKLWLAGILTQAQRRQLSLCMLEDILDTLVESVVVRGVMVVSCDTDVMALARAKGADVFDTQTDSGYAADVLKGIESLEYSEYRTSNSKLAHRTPAQRANKTLIIPADVPELKERDLVYLDRAHQGGVTLCPAGNDGGTNGLVFTPPLAMDLMYGDNSFDEFRKEAGQRRVPVNIARPAACPGTWICPKT